MRKKHYAPKPYEIKCCAIEVGLDEKHLSEFDFAKDPREVEVSEETKNYFFFPSRLAEKFEGFVGVTLNIPKVYVLFKFENQQNAIDY